MRRLLAESDPEVVKKLMANPGQWFAIAAGPMKNRHTYAQTAYRIRRGERVAFRPADRFAATIKVNQEWADPVELRAMFIPFEDEPSASPFSPEEEAESASSPQDAETLTC